MSAGQGVHNQLWWLAKTLFSSAVLVLLVTGLACRESDAALAPPPPNVQQVGTLDLDEAVRRRCEESQQWSDPKPTYLWIDQVEERNGITLRLIQGKFTTSSTFLEFLGEYPAEAGAPEYNARHRFMEYSLEGINRVSQFHFSSIWGCGGRELHILEGPGTVADPQSSIRIELSRITRRVGRPSDNLATAGWETVEGPWIFSVAPATPIK